MYHEGGADLLAVVSGVTHLLVLCQGASLRLRRADAGRCSVFAARQMGGWGVT